MSKLRKSTKYTNESVAGATDTPRKTKDRNARQMPGARRMERNWRRKIRQYKTRLEQGKKVLAEKIIPYFKEVQHRGLFSWRHS